MDDDKSFWTTEYCSLTRQFASLLGLYIKTCSIYLAVLGLALKFALDANATPELRFALCVFSVAMCVLYGVCIWAAERFVGLLQRRREQALAGLGKNIDSEFGIVHWASVVMACVTVAVLIGWVLIFLHFPAT